MEDIRTWALTKSTVVFYGFVDDVPSHVRYREFAAILGHTHQE